MEIALEDYRITWEPLREHNDAHLPDHLQPKLQQLFKEIHNPKPKTIETIQKLIDKYPDNNTLKNQLANAYHFLGEIEKSEEINELLFKEHPEYLFAKINKANQYAIEGSFEKIKELLGEEFNLKALYPHRNVFHISEFMAMQIVAVQYYIGIGDLEQAKTRRDLMVQTDSEMPTCDIADELLLAAYLEDMKKYWEIENRNRILPSNRFHVDNGEPFVCPEFNYKETYELYEYELDIPHAILDSFFRLDRKKVIEDLENVIKDSCYNFNEEEENFDFAVVHAVFLLSEMEATESLPVILEMMRQNETYFDYNFGEIFTEAGWMVLLKLGHDQLDLLADFLILPGIYTYFRTAVTDALIQITHYYPEKKNEVFKRFGVLLIYLNEASRDDNVIDSDFIGLFISDLIGFKTREFLPLIKKLYEKGYVSIGICGTYKSVENDLLNKHYPSSRKRKLLSIKELYDEFHIGKDENYPPENYFISPQKPVAKDKKIGRNDPCPCGSGKKYKKCCLR